MKKRRPNFLRRLVVIPITFYQWTLSFDHGPLRILYPYGFCRYYPTCSEYTKQAILRYGIVPGTLKGLFRILRCHPFSKGGIDHP